jgi:hypothetical protein
MSSTELFFIGIFTRNQQHTIIYVASDEFSQQERERMQSDVTLIVYNDFTHVDNVAATAIKWLKDITNSHFNLWDRVKFYEANMHEGVTCIRVSCMSIAEIKEKGLLHSKELDLVEFDMNKSRSVVQPPPVTHDPGLFTAEQRAYVDSVGNDVESLRSHLLHQVRLRDNSSANASFLERESNRASQIAIKLRSILEQLIVENPGSKLIIERADELAELRVKIAAKKDPPPRPVIQCDLKPMLLVEGATTPSQQVL